MPRVEVGVDVDVDGWEAAHRAAYGCGAWERACHQGGLLVAWYEEHDGGLGGPAFRRSLAHSGPRGKWPWGSGPHTLALVVWQSARDAGILVDQVPLADALRHCEPGAAPPAAGPLPDAARDGWIGIGSAEAVAGVRNVLRAHVTPDLPLPRPAGLRPTVGYRVRELLATPDWERGDWPAVLALAREAMGRADSLREQGAWQPTAQERSVYARLDLDRVLADGSAGPGRPAPSWPAQASRFVDLAATLSAAADTLPGDGRGSPGPLAQVLGATARACAGLRTSAEEVGRLWAAEPHGQRDPASWEPSHVPDALRVRTEETEHLVRAVSVFLWLLACG